MENPLLIVGWSARAAAQSALRGGFAPHAIDAFLDVDLQAAAVWSRRLAGWQEVVALAGTLPPREWMFCGGLENYPDVVAEISKRHRLLGVGAAALRRVRDPFALAEVLAIHGFAMPATIRKEKMPNREGESWLVKCFASAGGIGVRPFRHGEPISGGSYLQVQVPGAVWGATYLATNDGCRWLGVCEQIGDGDDAKTPFRYQGSIGPLPVADAMAAELQRLGVAVAAEFDLRGLFGIDLIVTPSGAIRPIEVNPRYTASVELLERARGGSMIERHVRACCGEAVGPIAESVPSTLFGKRIVYYEGREPHTITEFAVRQLLEWSLQDAEPSVADIPPAGTRIQSGDPIATVFAAGELESVQRGLAIQAERLLEFVHAPN